MKKLRLGVSIAAVLALGLTACASNNPTGSGTASQAPQQQQLSGTLNGGGASSQEAAMTAWIDAYRAIQPNVNVQYNPVGSGSGRKGFIAGQYSFAGSDAALKDDEKQQAQQQCGPDGAFQIPAYISPIAVAYNLPGIDGHLQMDANTIADIFNKKITKWNDPKIASQNQGKNLPDLAIITVHRSDDSGTTENFTDYLSVAAKDSWSYGKVQTWPKEITAENAQGTSGVVNLVKQREGAITYADASAITGLGSVAVKVGDAYVPFSEEAAAKAVETAQRVGTGNDMAVKLDRATTQAGVYPVVLVSYHIYCSSYKDQATVDLIKSFGEYVVSDQGQKAAASAAGNAPLSAAMQAEAKKSIESIKVQ
ncbi:phosphate ABC transporter substrate-binding protein PstS [Granulicoccus phenolivorans]|uniref:phosphate ABC transporter substrate-binding protein PstS n=1 Tax=Granulicoccus phenolivorans TaxID=266854 RepID=UPI000424A8D7|nr:phosphate ABC transporter substrate-binding protein PstS [Granulicoccus phenolivorans]